MRTEIRHTHRLFNKLSASLSLIALFCAAAFAVYSFDTSRAIAAPPGAPVITSFVCTQLAP